MACIVCERDGGLRAGLVRECDVVCMVVRLEWGYDHTSTGCEREPEREREEVCLYGSSCLVGGTL